MKFKKSDFIIEHQQNARFKYAITQKGKIEKELLYLEGTLPDGQSVVVRVDEHSYKSWAASKGYAWCGFKVVGLWADELLNSRDVQAKWVPKLKGIYEQK